MLTNVSLRLAWLSHRRGNLRLRSSCKYQLAVRPRWILLGRRLGHGCNSVLLLCPDRLAHHQAVQYRRTQIRGSDSSDEEEEIDDVEWGPATEL